MPISKEDFLKIPLNPSSTVLKFLKENSNQAFTIKEISENVNLKYQNILNILKALEEKKNISRRGSYWIICDTS